MVNQPVGEEVRGRSPLTGEVTRVRIADGVIAAMDTVGGDCAHWLAAGLIDLQVNGFGGHDVNAAEPDPAIVTDLAFRLAAEGVTTFVPTLVTAAHEVVTQRLQAIVSARQANPVVAQMVPYVHLEGPHLSGQDGPRGVHDLASIRPPSLPELDAWQEACGGLVGMMTLSPHFPGSTDFIRAVVSRGVHVAIGHTHADPDQIQDAADAGASFATHLGNGCHAMLPRHPNYLWAQLADDRLTAGFIADGHHLPDDTLIAMIRAKGCTRSVLVSDSVTLAGSPAGRYVTPVGGEVELHPDGRLTPLGQTILAGAARSLGDGVAHVAHATTLGLAGALDLATVNPDRFLPNRTSQDRRGVVAVGSRADLITFGWSPGDAHLDIQSTYVGGEVVYQRT